MTPILPPRLSVSQKPAAQSASLRHAPPRGLLALEGAQTLLFALSESWQLPEQHSEFKVQFAAAGAQDLQVPALHRPEAAPGAAQHWLLEEHGEFTGMQDEHAPFAQYEQPAGHWDESVHDWLQDSASTHTFTLAFSALGLHRPERQFASEEQLCTGLVIRHVPVSAAAFSYLQVMPEQHFCVSEQSEPALRQLNPADFVVLM